MVRLFLCLFKSCMSSMSFLPKELSCSDERSWMFEFPSHNIGPLIEFEWEISMACDPFGIGRIHDGFTGWSNCNRFF